ncbi:MAG: MCE family protein [Bacteroidetes bacterium]|nr:MCE family protein [Bacteroidota bacterium]
MSNPAKVGIFSVIAITIFILGFYFLKGIDIFTNENVYYAVYDRVDGLYKSNLVEVNGFPIGRVGKMSRNHDDGKIVVELVIEKGIKVPKSDSTLANLISTDFLGSKKVSLSFGNSKEYLKDGDTINTLFKRDLTEQLGSQIDPIMMDVRKIIPQLDTSIIGIKYLFDKRNPDGIYTTLGGINDALDKINSILADNQENLKLTIKNLQSISGNIEKSNEAITTILHNARSITDSLKQANLKQTVNNLNATVMELNGVIQGIKDGKGTIGKLVKEDELYTKLDTTVGNLNVLLKDVKERPYRYINVSVFGAKKHETRMEKRYNESGK